MASRKCGSTTARVTGCILSSVVRRSSSCSLAATNAGRTAILRSPANWRVTSREIAMAKTKTVPWDSAAYLKTDEDIGNYLEAVFEDGDPALITHALGVVARAKGMSQIAQAAGLGRESLYKALSPDGNPEFATVLKVMRALGLKLRVAA